MTWLNNSRILAIFAVIVLHVSAGVLSGSEPMTATWWCANFADSTSRWGVAVFIMISGALLLDTKKEDALWVFYKKRAARILIPLVFWALVYSTMVASESVVAGHEIPYFSLIKKAVAGVPYYHMWFLYMMVFLYVFTPFLRKVVRGSSTGELQFLTGLLFSITILNTAAGSLFPTHPGLFINWFLPHLAYFFLGHLISEDKIRLKPTTATVLLLVSISATAMVYYLLLKYKGTDAAQYIYNRNSITVVPMSVAVILLLRRWSAPLLDEKTTRTLATLSFGVYLVHALVLNYAALLFRHQDGRPAMLDIPLLSLLVFVLSLGLAWGISKVPYLRRTI